MNEQGFVLMNTEPTRHWSSTRSSLVDHVISNCPYNIDNIKTKHSFIVDHDVVGVFYHTEMMMDKPQFIKIRDWSNFSRENLIELLGTNLNLCSVLSMRKGTNKIWNIILIEFNNAINTLAPVKIVQVKNREQPYYNTEIKEQIEEAHKVLDEAISTGAIEEWR